MKEKNSHKEWLFFLDKFTSWEFTNKFSLLIINVVDFYREISTKGNICFGKIVKGIAVGIAWFHDAVTSHLVFPQDILQGNAYVWGWTIKAQFIYIYQKFDSPNLSSKP